MKKFFAMALLVASQFSFAARIDSRFNEGILASFDDSFSVNDLKCRITSYENGNTEEASARERISFSEMFSGSVTIDVTEEGEPTVATLSARNGEIVSFARVSFDENSGNIAGIELEVSRREPGTIRHNELDETLIQRFDCR